jgi:nucleotide-binding universal stress UspA family protein
MYKRILVPIDGSETAMSGLREAMKFAKEQNAQIRLIHVVDELVLTPYPYGPAVIDDIITQLRGVGKAVLAKARAMVQEAGINVDTQLIEAFGGRAGEDIVKAAQDWPADIVVCGTHGRRGLRRIVMGSDAEYIVRRSPVPVLLVRAAGGE